TDAGLYTEEQLEALVAERIDAAVAEAVAKAKGEVGPARKRMPRERQSITHKFSLGGHEGYITAGMYEDGSVGEIFLTDIGTASSRRPCGRARRPRTSSAARRAAAPARRTAAATGTRAATAAATAAPTQPPRGRTWPRPRAPPPPHHRSRRRPR